MAMRRRVPCPVCHRRTPVYRSTQELWAHDRDGRQCRGSWLVVDVDGGEA